MSSGNSTGGISIVGLLGVAFVVLKLCGVIDWSWLWVTAPFWLPVAFLLLIALVAGVIGIVLVLTDKKPRRSYQ